MFRLPSFYNQIGFKAWRTHLSTKPSRKPGIKKLLLRQVFGMDSLHSRGGWTFSPYKYFTKQIAQVIMRYLYISIKFP